MTDYASAFQNAARPPRLDPKPAGQPKADPALAAVEAWRAGILGSPEAADRPAAAALIVARHVPSTMPVDRARAFLAGLPKETATEQPQVDPTAVLRRRAELALANAMGNSGNPAAKRKAEAIGSALRLHDERGVSLARALEVHFVTL